MPAATRCRLSRFFVVFFLGGTGRKTWKAGESWKCPQKPAFLLILVAVLVATISFIWIAMNTLVTLCQQITFLCLVFIAAAGSREPKSETEPFSRPRKHSGHPWTRIFPLLKQSSHRELHMEQLHLPGAKKQIKPLQSVGKRVQFKKHVQNPPGPEVNLTSFIFFLGGKIHGELQFKCFEISLWDFYALWSFSLWLGEGVLLRAVRFPKNSDHKHENHKSSDIW